MSRKSFLLTVFLTTASLGSAWFLTMGYAQVRSQSDDVPIAEYGVSRQENPYDAELRKNRGCKYKSRTPIDKMEAQPSVMTGHPSHWPVEPAFPVAKSDLVITGTISDARAFISEDATAVYSEFQITVNEILKNNPRLNISRGSTVTADRLGGRVKFPSGRVQLRGELGRSLPRKNKQYILFLSWDEAAQDFSVLTGYEITGRSVVPLDGNSDVSGDPVFANYTKYQNANLSTVLDEIRELVHGGGEE
jgi:hypothetical protein